VAEQREDAEHLDAARDHAECDVVDPVAARRLDLGQRNAEQRQRERRIRLHALATAAAGAIAGSRSRWIATGDR
jgi:hypothetical protein